MYTFSAPTELPYAWYQKVKQTDLSIDGESVSLTNLAFSSIFFNLKIQNFNFYNLPFKIIYLFLQYSKINLN